MNLRQLGYFVAIAEEHQLTAAARRLHISQPPLSYELASLERELGVTLVDRGPRGVTLTEAGEVLYKRSLAILDMVGTTEREVEGFGKGQRGTLTVGIISSSGGQVPNDAMRAFTQDYPSVRFRLREGNTYEVLDLLRKGAVDVGVVRTPFDQSGLELVYLDPEPMVALMPEGFVCGSDPDVVRISELSGVPVVLYRRFERIVEECFLDADAELFASCVNDDARTTSVWAKKGMGVGLVPQSFLSMVALDGVTVKRVDEKRLVTRMCIAWPKGRRLSSLAQRFVQMFEPAQKDGPGKKGETVEAGSVAQKGEPGKKDEPAKASATDQGGEPQQDGGTAEGE
ncbi:MAG: LysR family transcriptional regulator [Atopobiaceae bacterium]